MFKALKRVVYQVSDLAGARQWYAQVLETEPMIDSPFFVAFVVGDAMLALVPTSKPSPSCDERIIAFWGVDDADAAYARLLECGATVHTEIGTVMQTRAAKVIDPFGNIIGITGSPGDAHKQPVEQRASESAHGVTFCRALAALDDREAFRGPDHLAEIFLADESRKILQSRASREYIIEKMVTPLLYGYVLARTRYFDGIFVEALEADIPQIVLLGAGYDSRAYRFADRLGSCRVFELDVASTQQRKRQLLAKAQVAIPPQLTYVTINFKTDGIADVLSQAGFDPATRTLFLWEGVTYYLTAEAVGDTLDFIKQDSGPGSAICFDYMNRHVDSVYAGEPFLFWMDSEEMPSLLSEHGLAIIEHLRPAEIEKQLLTGPDGTPFGQTLPYFDLVRATLQD